MSFGWFVGLTVWGLLNSVVYRMRGSFVLVVVLICYFTCYCGLLFLVCLCLGFF